jgi:hypothetical protein
MESAEEIYKSAYELHYKKMEFEKALALYKAIIESYSQSPEAAYSRTQIENIGKSQPYADYVVEMRQKVTLGNERDRLIPAIEIAKADHIRKVNGVWEYLVQINIGTEELNRVGNLGWQLVSVTSYHVGIAALQVVHMQYTFKRLPVPPTQ